MTKELYEIEIGAKQWHEISAETLDKWHFHFKGSYIKFGCGKCVYQARLDVRKIGKYFFENNKSIKMATKKYAFKGAAKNGKSNVRLNVRLESGVVRILSDDLKDDDFNSLAEILQEQRPTYFDRFLYEIKPGEENPKSQKSAASEAVTLISKEPLKDDVILKEVTEIPETNFLENSNEAKSENPEVKVEAPKGKRGRPNNS